MSRCDTTAHENAPSAYAVTRLGGQRLFSLHGAVSPPMSLARDADLAQRTVHSIESTRGRSFSFGVLTAVAG
jgi:hypothetical protein